MTGLRNLPFLAIVFALGMTLGLATRPARKPPSVRELPAAPFPAETSTPAEIPESAEWWRNNPAPPDFATRLAALLATPNRYKRSRLIAGVADNLDGAALRDALARLDKVHFKDRDKVLFTLLTRWGELEPKAAFAYAQKIEADNGSSPVAQVVKGWCLKDAAEAEKWMEKLPPGLTKEASRAALIEALAVSDPKRAFAIVQKDSSYSSAVESLFSAWVETDPQEAATYAVQLPAGSARTSAMGATARSWARKDMTGALAWAQAVSSEDAPTPWPASVLAIALNEWIDEAPEQAVSWIQQMPDEREREKALAGLCGILSFNDRNMAARLVAMMPSGKAQDQAVQQIAYEWTIDDVSGAVAWAREQTDPHLRELIVPAIAWPLAGKDPQGAMDLALTLSGQPRDEAVTSVLKSWAQTNPLAAANWATTNQGNSKYISSVAAVWIRKDQQAATDWAAALPAGRLKDEVLSETANEFAQTLPELAVSWTAGISDESRQLGVYTEIGETWLLWDTNAAREWIADAPLPPELKRKLLEGDVP